MVLGQWWPRYRYDQLMRLGWKVFLAAWSLVWVCGLRRAWVASSSRQSYVRPTGWAWLDRPPPVSIFPLGVRVKKLWG